MLDIPTPGEDGRLQPLPAAVAIRNPSTTADDPEVLSILSDFKKLGIEVETKQITRRERFQNLIKEVDANERATNTKMPSGVYGLTLPVWRKLIASAALCYRTTKKISVDAVLKFEPSLRERTVVEAFETREFRDALRIAGVTASWIGLTEKQMLALSVVTNLSNTKTLSSKLKSVGVKGWEWEQWLSDPKFKKLVRNLGEDLLDSHIPTVNMALIQRAESGDLGSIKYVNELTGRYRPNQESQVNIREFLMAVINILNNTIDDPELLRKIGSKLATLSGGTGVMTAQEISPMEVIDEEPATLNL